MIDTASIGVFDSGVGGLSVLRALLAELPEASFIYVADQDHVPYGPRSLEEVRGFSEGITRFLLDQGAELIVIACNAASAAALLYLRRRFPAVPFVGMEPAVKPAAERTNSGVVGVLATPATFQGALYASVVERFASGVRLLQDTCPGLVAQVETGDVQGEKTRAILERALQPMLAEGIDTVVLGCTHYPFVIPLIQEIVGPNVRVIDPAPAVARQARRLLEERGLQPQPVLHSTSTSATIIGYAQNTPARFFTTGDPAAMRRILSTLTGEDAPVLPLLWQGDRLIPPPE